jgi:hypothetical protein
MDFSVNNYFFHQT